ncbi:MAG: GTPase domain-containing protein, partial [Bacteroidota bacterium]
ISAIKAAARGVFDYALWSFQELSAPLLWGLGFTQMNWPYMLGIIIAPALIVLLIASCFILFMYALQGTERLIQYWYGIRFPCAVCARKSEPAEYACPSCGRRHEVQLIPSVYGVLNHTCTNELCNQKLPTLMLTGRHKKLKRYCPNKDCGTQLNDVVGTDKHLALVGGRNAGKTCLLVQTANYLIDNFDAKLPEKAQADTFNRLSGLIAKGAVPPQTQRVANYRAFQLEYGKKTFPYHLHLYDIAGENFEHVFDAASYPFYKNLDGLIFIFDPYSISAFRQKYPPPANMLYSSQEPYEVLQNLVQALEKHSTKAKIKKIKLNVVLVKTDTGYLNRVNGLKEPGPVQNAALKSFIRHQAESQAFVELAHSIFRKVHYFHLSALGRTPSRGNMRPFVGANVQLTISSIYQGIGVSI